MSEYDIALIPIIKECKNEVAIITPLVAHHGWHSLSQVSKNKVVGQ